MALTARHVNKRAELCSIAIREHLLRPGTPKVVVRSYIVADPEGGRGRVGEGGEGGGGAPGLSRQKWSYLKVVLPCRKRSSIRSMSLYFNYTCPSSFTGGQYLSACYS